MRLHPQLGINPHLTYCRRCGGDANELVLIGDQTRKFKCDRCNLIHYGTPGSSHISRFGTSGYGRYDCPNKDCGGVLQEIERLAENEKIPAQELCDSCKAELKLHAEIVAAGGVYWRCKKCGRDGVLKHTAPYAEAVRKSTNIFPPDPVGVEFSEEDPCFVCTGAVKEEDCKDAKEEPPAAAAEK